MSPRVGNQAGLAVPGGKMRCAVQGGARSHVRWQGGAQVVVYPGVPRWYPGVSIGSLGVSNRALLG